MLNLSHESYITGTLPSILETTTLHYFQNEPFDTVKIETIDYFERHAANDLHNITEVMNFDCWMNIIGILFKSHSSTLFFIIIQISNGHYTTKMLPFLTAPPIKDKSALLDIANQMNVNMVLFKPISACPDYVVRIEEFFVDIIVPIDKAKHTCIVYTDPIDCWFIEDHLIQFNSHLHDIDISPALTIESNNIDREFLLTYDLYDTLDASHSLMELNFRLYYNYAKNKATFDSYFGDSKYTAVLYTWSSRAASKIRLNAGNIKEFVIQAIKTASSVNGALIIIHQKQFCCISRDACQRPWVACCIDDNYNMTMPSYTYQEISTKFTRKSVCYFINHYGHLVTA